MADETSFWGEAARAISAITASATVVAMAWGAAGGLTSAVAVPVPLRAAVRQIVAGALVAAGIGSSAGTLIVLLLKLDASWIPLFGATGISSYVVGVIGPALIELVLTRIKRGSGPGRSNGEGA